MKKVVALCVLLVHVSSVAFANSDLDKISQIFGSYSCPVALKVNNVYGAIVLGKDVHEEEGVNYTLEIIDIKKSLPKCNKYMTATKMDMNAVHEFLPKLSDLQVGDVIYGAVNSHLPSPHGKALAERFHNGLHISAVERTDGRRNVYDIQKSPYFRNVAVY